MILHLLYKNEKFIDYIIDYFEFIAPNQNIFLISGESKNPDFNFVKPKNIEKIKYAAEYSEEYFRLIESLNNYKVVISHGLDVFRSKIIQKMPQEITVAWILFGGEVYNCFPEYRRNLFFPKTEAIHLSLQSKIKGYINSFLNKEFYLFTRKFIYTIFSRKSLIEQELIKGMRRSDYLGFVIREEYYDISKKLALKGKCLEYTYYNIEDTVSTDLIDKRVTGNGILIGNSSSSSNNHFEIIEYLSKQNLADRKVIVPLSYGDQKYKEEIIKLGNKFLPNSFHPLTKFIPRESYNQILLDCSVAIMNHRRQQAVGTVLTLLWLGVKIFLNEENAIYTFLKRIGIIVFSIRKDLINNDFNSITKLSLEDINYNRKILINEFGKEVVLKKNKNFLDSLLKNKQ